MKDSTFVRQMKTQQESKEYENQSNERAYDVRKKAINDSVNGKPVPLIAQEIGVTPEAVKGWVDRFQRTREIHSGPLHIKAVRPFRAW